MLPKLRVIEFFSGIGGWAASLKQLYQNHKQPDDYTIVQSVDINETANAIYQFNFKSPVLCKSIESIKITYLEKLNVNCWCMSPPCQPFTRNNTTSVRDNNDNRTDALLHLLSILQQLSSPPQYICLENVVGFESSACCEKMLSVLLSLGYIFHQFLLTPTQFGVPNERPRYYLTCCLNQNNTHKRFKTEINFVPNYNIYKSLDCFHQRNGNNKPKREIKSIQHYLDDQLNTNQELLVSKVIYHIYL